MQFSMEEDNATMTHLLRHPADELTTEVETDKDESVGRSIDLLPSPRRT